MALVAIATLFPTACARPPVGPYGIGVRADPLTIARLDIDVAPDGSGLPRGSGTPARGATIFASSCARCHGATVRLDPERWPYATSVFDYVRRAMPPDRATHLTDAEVYAVTAYALFASGDIGPNDTMDSTTIGRVTMPKIKAFFEVH